MLSSVSSHGDALPSKESWWGWIGEDAKSAPPNEAEWAESGVAVKAVAGVCADCCCRIGDRNP